ncbi:MAG: WYL domain-containing protein, partial [Rhodoferax sp.]|nr:WYL domain-containing protein [Rhodoferax sp.]
AESPLATNQVIAPHTGPNGGSELKATLTDSALLVWWIRSQGDGVQVLGPNELMDDIKATKLA